MTQPPGACLEFENVQWFADNCGALQGLDWGTFLIRPSRNPLMDSFWGCSELKDDLSESVYLSFVTYLVNYYQDYLSATSPWDLDTGWLTAKYFADTKTLLSVNQDIQALLMPEGRKHAAELSRHALAYLHASDTFGKG
jgi:hypothetical protein